MCTARTEAGLEDVERLLSSAARAPRILLPERFENFASLVFLYRSRRAGARPGLPVLAAYRKRPGQAPALQFHAEWRTHRLFELRDHLVSAVMHRAIDVGAERK